MRYIITGTGTLMIVIEGYSYTLHNEHPWYKEILRVLQEGKDFTPKATERLLYLIDTEEAEAEFGIKHDSAGHVFINGELTEDARELVEKGASLQNVVLKKTLEKI